MPAVPVPGALRRIADCADTGGYRGDPAATRRDIEVLDGLLATNLDANGRRKSELLLAHLLMNRYEQGDVESLDRALELLGPMEHNGDWADPLDRAGLRSLAATLLRDSESKGDPIPVRRAIRIMRRLAQRQGTADDWSLLGFMLAHEYTLSGDDRRLRQATKACQRALAPPGASYSLMTLTRSASVYTALAEYTNADADFEEARRIHRLALERVDEADPLDAAHHWSNYGAFMTQYCGRRPGGPLLDEAVDACQRAVALVPQGHYDLPRFLVNLGAALVVRYEQTADMTSLSAGARAYHDAAALVAAGHALYAGALAGRAGALLRIVEAQPDTSTAAEAVEIAQQAVDATPPGHPNRANRLGLLAGVLLRRHENVRPEVADLDRAENAVREAIPLLSGKDEHKAILEGNLGAVLSARYEATGTMSDLDAAINAHTLAVKLTPPAHVDRAGRIMNLAIVERMRADTTHDRQRCAAAIRTARTAVTAAPLGHPVIGRARVVLAETLETFYRITTDPGDARAAVEAFRDAMDTAVGVVSRVRAAIGLGRLAADLADFPTALDGYAGAVDSMARAVARSLPRPDQERVLAMLVGIPQDAAAMAIQIGDPARATVLLEQGRAVLLNRAVQARTEDDLLTQHHPNLAKELVRVETTLTRAEQTTDPLTREPTSSPRVEDLIELAQAHDQLLDDIRRLPEFSQFRTAPSATDIMAATHRGPVVVVNVSRHRCDALVVTDNGIQVIPLPDLTIEDLERHATDFLDATSSGDNTGLKRVSGWTWEAIVDPILTALHPHTTAKSVAPPRLWWCPTGLVSFLPLHVATRLDQKGDPDHRQSCLELTIPSYTPTIMALGGPDPNEPGKTSGPALVIAVGEPNPKPETVADSPQWGSLDVQGDVDAVTRAFPHARVLTAEQADKDTVVEALTQAAVAHFACHASGDVQAPSNGHLALHADTLTVAELIHAHASGGVLAYLSACESFRGGTAIPDEVITIATALQIAGYRHVIATHWVTSDSYAPLIADTFYQHLLTAPGTIDVRDAAAALRTAMLSIRDTDNPPLLYWGSHVHVGP